MNERIKTLRKEGCKLTQQEFAARLGITGAALSRIESGERGVSEQLIRSICREFNVNESWLRDGIGEMLRQPSRDEELTEFFADVLADKPVEFRRRLVRVLSRLDVEHWHLLEDMARMLAEDNEKADPEE